MTTKSKLAGLRSKRPVVTGKETQTRMVRVHVDFATWLVEECRRQKKQYGRKVTITELTQSLSRRLSE